MNNTSACTKAVNFIYEKSLLLFGVLEKYTGNYWSVVSNPAHSTLPKTLLPTPFCLQWLKVTKSMAVGCSVLLWIFLFPETNIHLWNCINIRKKRQIDKRWDGSLPYSEPSLDLVAHSFSFFICVMFIILCQWVTSVIQCHYI